MPVHGCQQQPALVLRGEAGKSPPTLHNTRWLPTSIETEDDRMQALEVTMEIAAQRVFPSDPDFITNTQKANAF